MNADLVILNVLAAMSRRSTTSSGRRRTTARFWFCERDSREAKLADTERDLAVSGDAS